MVEFSTQTTGLPVQYIELTNGRFNRMQHAFNMLLFPVVAVTIVSNDLAKVFCALICDREDGYDFGKLIATQALLAFISQYSTDLGKVGPNLRDFRGFENKIPEILRNAVKPVLFRCKTQTPKATRVNSCVLHVLVQEDPGVVKCILMTEDSTIHSTAAIDQLDAISNLQGLLGSAAEISELQNIAKCSIALVPNGHVNCCSGLCR